jgi:hypothetical protein
MRRIDEIMLKDEWCEGTVGFPSHKLKKAHVSTHKNSF